MSTRKRVTRGPMELTLTANSCSLDYPRLVSGDGWDGEAKCDDYQWLYNAVDSDVGIIMADCSRQWYAWYYGNPGMDENGEDTDDFAQEYEDWWRWLSMEVADALHDGFDVTLRVWDSPDGPNRVRAASNTFQWWSRPLERSAV